MLNDSISENYNDRFSAVDSVASQIFDSMHDIGLSPDDLALADDDQVIDLMDQYLRPTPTILKRTEHVVGALIQVLDDRNKALKAATTELANKKYTAPQDGSAYQMSRTGPHQSRSGGVLAKSPCAEDEDRLMNSIREMMDDQEAEQRAIAIDQKRKASRRALPDLEPQQDLPEAHTSDVIKVAQENVVHRVRAALHGAFKRDFFLACAFTVWSALAMAVFVTPSVTGKLLVALLLLLCIAGCLSPKSRRFRPQC